MNAAEYDMSEDFVPVTRSSFKSSRSDAFGS